MYSTWYNRFSFSFPFPVSYYILQYIPLLPPNSTPFLGTKKKNPTRIHTIITARVLPECIQRRSVSVPVCNQESASVENVNAGSGHGTKSPSTGTDIIDLPRFRSSVLTDKAKPQRRHGNFADVQNLQFGPWLAQCILVSWVIFRTGLRGCFKRFW